MERTWIADVTAGKQVKVQGFVETVRDGKAMAFLVVRDITGALQVTVEKERHPDLCDDIARLTPDSVVTVTGMAAANESVRLGGIELIPDSLRIESIAEPLPISRKEIPATKKKSAVERSSIDQRIDARWVDLRTEENQLLFQVQTTLVHAMRSALLERRFIEIHSPKLIGAASESGADVFEVKYFDRKAYLAQSPQFYKQMAMAGGLERVFEGGRSSARKSPTRAGIPPSLPASTGIQLYRLYHDVMRLEEDLLRAGLSAVRNAYGRQSWIISEWKSSCRRPRFPPFRCQISIRHWRRSSGMLSIHRRRET
jgi:aspartyl-tRNA synthetase